MKVLSPIIALFLVVVYYGCGDPAQAAGNEPSEADRVIAVKVATVTTETLTAPVIAVGAIATDQEARPAFKIGGIITKTYVEEGDVVRRGQLLATLNPTEIDAQVKQATAAVDKAQRDLERANNLYTDSVATLEQVQDATTGLTVAEQNLQMARFNQQQSSLRAPFNGKVVRRLMSEGEVVGPGTPIYYLLSNDRQDWVIRAGLSDRDWARLNVGDPAEIRLDAYPNQLFNGKVGLLASVANPQSGTFDAEFAFTGPTPRLAVGLVANVEVQPKTVGQQLVIPLDALLESNGHQAYVFVLGEGNQVSRRALTIGQIYQDKVVVLKGLAANETVITTGAAYLEEGRTVKVVE